MNRLGLTRTVVTRSYALLTPDARVSSSLPGWSGSTPVVLISAAMGASFSQYLIALHDGGRGEGDTGTDQWFFFVVSGRAAVNGTLLTSGGFAYVPPGARYDVVGPRSDATGAEADAVTSLLVFRKRYEGLAAGAPPPGPFAGHEAEIAETPFLGDPHARLKVLMPETPTADMAVNIFTYDPGATLAVRRDARDGARHALPRRRRRSTGSTPTGIP